MTERLFLPGKFTDLSGKDPRQLGLLTDLVNQLLAITNSFDQNSFALAWIEGSAAGQVIVSKGVGNAPEWDTAPTLTGATFSGLTASKLVVTDGAKALATLTASSAYTPTNVTTDRSYDANATTLDEVADVLGTVIADLKSKGILG